MNRNARNDAIAGALVLAVVAIFAPAVADIYIDPLDPGFSARDFPIGVLALLGAFAAAMLGRALVVLARSGWRLYAPGEAAPLLRHVVPMIALGFAYVWFINMFQYPLPTVFATAGALAMYGNRGVARLVAAPVIAALVYYVLFYGILGLYEEPGTVWSYNNQWYFRPLRDALGLF